MAKQGITPVTNTGSILRIMLIAIFFSVDVTYVIKELRKRDDLQRFANIDRIPSAEEVHRYLSRIDEAQFCHRRCKFVHFRRSKSVHSRTLKHVFEGRGNVHCGGIFRDSRLASSGAEHQPDLTKDRVSPKHGTEIPSRTNRADTGTPQNTTE